MGELAAHLVDGVLGGLPVRQWVLTLPFRLRYRLAYDHRLCRAVLGVFVRALLGFEQRRARVLGMRARARAVTAIQRCGSALNTNVHFHTLVAEGVFEEQPDGSHRFVPLREPPSDVEVARLLAAVRGRIIRLLRRHDIDLEGGFDDGRSDPLALESPVLAQVQGASVLGRVATGPRAGQRVLRLGSDPTGPVVITGGPRHAHIEGFDLHANVAVRAGDNERLEHLCRYILRPPVAQDALEWRPDGTVLLRLRRPWRDGTRAICFEPSELLEKLAAMIPRPRINLLIYHGAFAPRGRCHSGPVVVEDAPHRVTPPTSGSAPEAGATPVAYVRPSYFAWADLLRRVFAIDVLACPDCGGRLRLLATIEDRAVVEKILTHLGLPVDLPQPSAARTPAWLSGVRDTADNEDHAGAHWADLPNHRRNPHVAATGSAQLRPDQSLTPRFGRLTAACGSFYRGCREGQRKVIRPDRSAVVG